MLIKEPDKHFNLIFEMSVTYKKSDFSIKSWALNL